MGYSSFFQIVYKEKIPLSGYIVSERATTICNAWNFIGSEPILTYISIKVSHVKNFFSGKPS